MAAAIVHHTGAGSIELPKDEITVEANSMGILSALAPYMPTSSLLPEFVEKRAYYEGTGQGYVGNGPRIEPTPYELFRSKNLNKPEEKSQLLKTLHILLSVGASALAAKWYITRVIEKKMQEAEASQEFGAKIHLVKSASELKTAYKLAKADMIRAVSRR